MRFFCACLIATFITANAIAADHRVEVLKEAPPEEVSKEIAGKLSATGLRVIRGTSRTVCDIWLCKEWAVDAKFEPTAEVLYPFAPGQLIGVARYPRRGSDFRDQDVNKGVYTLRYAHQPNNGSHIGTSPTRDFLLLVSSENDKKSETFELESLVEKSSEAAGSSHPAMLCLQRVVKKPEGKPAIRHNEEHDWWIVSVQGNAKAGKKEKALPIDLVIVGISSET